MQAPKWRMPEIRTTKIREPAKSSILSETLFKPEGPVCLHSILRP